MSVRASTSGSRRRRATLPDAIGDYPLGRQTGLPLIVCDECGLQRVLELVVQSDDNRNKGKVFFKCPMNIQGVSGGCGFFEWQRGYLAKLVENGKVAMVLGQHSRGLGEATTVVSTGARSVQLLHGQLVDLTSALKALCLSIVAMTVVLVCYLSK